ncbi:flagellar filament capping protein FliD [Pseudogulbenkiania sp. MAI-1]|uniref:flagellar filament capping protein FliD n=1 Tax=Pseudogulbenkiania sp. MAI-1 TaxID=990370 RepID=UPI00045E7857|nr:flagellar filament capping protein FliD [Pseudogulbenkiania sp. MAI-1]
MASISTTAGSLDVQGLVSQLMTIERQPLTASQSRLSSYNSQLSDLGNLKSQLSTLQTKARALTTLDFVNIYKSTSSDTTVLSGTAGADASAGVYQINVTKLATSEQKVFDLRDGGSAITDKAAAIAGLNGSFSITVGGTTTAIDLGASDVSLDTLRQKINAADIGVNATIVSSQGNYKLVLASEDSGSANAFSFATPIPVLGQSATAVSESKTATDAELTINGVAITASSNTITDAISGISLSLSKLGSANLTVARDESSIIQKVQDFVDQFNTVKNLTGSLRSGSLKGDASLLSIQQRLTSVLTKPVSGYDPTTDYAYLSQIGISIQKDGTLKLDQSAFKKAMNDNLDNVSKLFGNTNNDGFGDRFVSQVTDLLGTTGILETRTATVNIKIKDEELNQDRIQERLDNKEASYLRQYSALDAALTEIQRTSSYLQSLLG